MEGQGLAEPCLQLTVNGKRRWFMVDTGARYSTLAEPMCSLSSHYVSVLGFSGTEQRLPFTVPLPVWLGRQVMEHPFLYAPDCPRDLLGRDVLAALGASVHCSPEAMIVSFPGGEEMVCSSPSSADRMCMLSPDTSPDAPPPCADIYWALLADRNPLIDFYNMWQPWIRALHPYLPVPDPPHCTLNYDRNNDLTYQDEFQQNLLDTTWGIGVRDVYIAPAGVAAAVKLTPAQEQWHRMSEEAVPHVSLAIAPKHQAKDLGPMVKTAAALTDWVPTSLLGVSLSPSSNIYRLSFFNAVSGICKHELLTRQHGREMLDGEGATSMLAALPSSLWSTCPFDVGRCSMEPVTFEMNTYCPIWRPQYKHKVEAAQGISPTIEGLLKAGVLRKSYSQWNTPILPVLKPSGSYRMAHDLRAINELVLTPVTPVPNPHSALSMLTPAHTSFTCIDLANAFFCLPLADHLQDIFSFTYEGQRLTYNVLPQGFILSPSIFNKTLRTHLAGLELPEGCFIVQYVDDLLVAAPLAEVCLSLTHALLLRLHNYGYKVSKEKLQCCRTQVSFLGRMVSPKGTAMSPAHRDSILHHPKPQTVKEMLSFLGLTGYSRQQDSHHLNLRVADLSQGRPKTPLPFLTSVTDHTI